MFLSISGGMTSGVMFRGLATVQCSVSVSPACTESLSFKIVPSVLGNISSILFCSSVSSPEMMPCVAFGLSWFSVGDVLPCDCSGIHFLMMDSSNNAWAIASCVVRVFAWMVSRQAPSSFSIFGHAITISFLESVLFFSTSELSQLLTVKRMYSRIKKTGALLPAFCLSFPKRYAMMKSKFFLHPGKCLPSSVSTLQSSMMLKIWNCSLLRLACWSSWKSV